MRKTSNLRNGRGLPLLEAGKLEGEVQLEESYPETYVGGGRRCLLEKGKLFL